MADIQFQAATYDFWNTLVAETTTSIDRRRVLWTEVLLKNGYEISQDHLDSAFAAGWNTFDTNWRKNIQTDLESVVSTAVAKLPIAVNAEVETQLLQAYLLASEETPRYLLPETKETLQKLKDAGLKLAVICDVGTIPSSQLRHWLSDLGVFELFDFFGFSDEIHVYKPHPRIFTETLEGLGISDPSRCFHVGDLKRTDVAGARSIGMTTVRYTGGREDNEEGDEADYVISSHLQIFNQLGII